MDNNENGKWITVKGRHVFIKDGQSVADAIDEFETYKKAKGNPEEIDAMTENSYDFESLNEIYGDKDDSDDSDEEKGKKINETMNKREEIIKNLDEQTKDLEEYDKYNLAVSKLENTDGMSPTEKQYWAGERERFLKAQKERENTIDSLQIGDNFNITTEDGTMGNYTVTNSDDEIISAKVNYVNSPDYIVPDEPVEFSKDKLKKYYEDNAIITKEVNVNGETINLEDTPSKNEKFSTDYWKSRSVDMYDSAPDGWSKLEGATTAPKGYAWYSNNKSRFSDEYRHALVKEDETNNGREKYY